MQPACFRLLNLCNPWKKQMIYFKNLHIYLEESLTPGGLILKYFSERQTLTHFSIYTKCKCRCFSLLPSGVSNLILKTYFQFRLSKNVSNLDFSFFYALILYPVFSFQYFININVSVFSMYYFHYLPRFRFSYFQKTSDRRHDCVGDRSIQTYCPHGRPFLFRISF